MQGNPPGHLHLLRRSYKITTMCVCVRACVCRRTLARHLLKITAVRAALLLQLLQLVSITRPRRQGSVADVR